MSTSTKQKFFPALTGVRALAAIMVFLTHFGYVLFAWAPAWVQRYCNELSIGLPMFFVLTGFLITVRYYDSFELTTKWAKKYWISRAARLYPMYFIFTTLAFIYWYFNRGVGLIGNVNHAWFTLFLNYTFLRGFFDDLKFTGVGQGWSITVDVLFYVITPIVFYLVKKDRKSLIWQPLVYVPMGYLLVYIFGRLNWYGFMGNIVFMLYYTFFGRCIEIFVGMALALYYHKMAVNQFGRIKLTYIGFILMFVCVYCFTLIPLGPGEVFGIKTYTGMILDTVFLTPAIGLFFLGLIREDTIMQRVLSGKFVTLLSNSSFLFYLIHLGPINNFIHEGINKLNDLTFAFYDKHGLDWHSPFEYDALNVFYILTALFAVSIFIYKFVEEPLNRRVKELLTHKKVHAKPLDAAVSPASINSDIVEVK
jgi:peptidoglycan/LPS O-acetylase OafA/YrhL